MTEALQLLTIVVAAFLMGEWALLQGRKERKAMRRVEDNRQQSIYFPEQPGDDQHRGAAMSRTTL